MRRSEPTNRAEWQIVIGPGRGCSLHLPGIDGAYTVEELAALYQALGRSPTVRRLATAPRATLAAAEAAQERADDIGAAAIRAALLKAGGNVGAAAKALGIPRRTLDRRIAAAGLREWLTGAYPLSVRQPKR